MNLISKLYTLMCYKCGHYWDVAITEPQTLACPVCKAGSEYTAKTEESNTHD